MSNNIPTTSSAHNSPALPFPRPAMQQKSAQMGRTSPHNLELWPGVVTYLGRYPSGVDFAGCVLPQIPWGVAVHKLPGWISESFDGAKPRACNFRSISGDGHKKKARRTCFSVSAPGGWEELRKKQCNKHHATIRMMLFPQHSRERAYLRRRLYTLDDVTPSKR
jgi:hypothetical protein